MDTTDRKLLSLLQQNSSAKYADLARQLHLSPPAVHERVKKLRASGVIRNNTINIDPAAIGAEFCAIVHVDTDGSRAVKNDLDLAGNGHIEEMHTVAGDSCMILKVRTANALQFESFLSDLLERPGIIRTQSFVVLQSYIERGTDPALFG